MSHDKFKRGDMVLVIGIEDGAPADWPKPGAIGEVSSVCICAWIAADIVAHRVKFAGQRVGCYEPRHLKKIEPPTPGVTTDTPTTESVS